MLELVEDEGVQLFGVYLAVFGEYALLGGGVDDLADDGVEALRLAHLRQFALHHHGELLDDRGVDALALCRMVAGALELVHHFVAGGDAEKVRCVHVRAVGEADGERLALEDVLRGPVVFVDEQGDAVAVADHAPRRVHGVDLAVFVVCRHDQHGHGVDRLHDAEIFFHGVCPPVILDLPFRQPYDTMEGKQKQVPTFL